MVTAMSKPTPEPVRVSDYEELKPLIELCKAGRLFDVQEWIAAGQPVNPPPIPVKGRRPRSPLDITIEQGFHSLVEVLLRAGAAIEPEGWDSPMSKALQMRRFDLVRLLVENGYDPTRIDMQRVFDSWDPEIMVYFIERGADIRTGQPFAYALCNRIRTALRIYKEHAERVPSLQEQANIALRHHCKEGNMKWVSLLLWAGADPYKPGADTYEETQYDDEEGLCALGYAALYGHYEVFEIKQIRASLNDAGIIPFVRYLCKGRGIDILNKLLRKGLGPNDQDNGGSSAIQDCLVSMGWAYQYDHWNREPLRKNIDTEESRDRIKAIHLLAKHGARWIPQDKAEISEARRSLLKLTPDHTVEFVWIMSKYKGCDQDAIHQLLSTPTMKRHISSHRARVQEIISVWE